MVGGGVRQEEDRCAEEKTTFLLSILTGSSFGREDITDLQRERSRKGFMCL